ncbi:tetratricopeptide repeat protein [Kribbella sp. NPDC056861]|uniref:tetratricopeptide repeat protein n=1 Tax=Kribbella sp. NPDC056861 TaxID=3154857 RepID=UPI0034345F12
MSDDLLERLQRAESAPYGKARSALLEDVVRRADAAGNQELGFYARLGLVTAYVMGGEARKSLVPFARCVADWDAEPERYSDHTHTFLWTFKYAPSTLSQFPEVPLAQTYGVLDDMERRWRTGGHSMHAVHQYRWMVADHIGDAETAAEQYRLWSTAPRDSLSDCVGCDPTSKVQHLIGTGRPADAVALAVGVLDGTLTCAEQPQQMLTELLPAYVAEGMYSEAVDAHRRAYRALRNLPGELNAYASHVVFCARTGNETRAVELVERHLGELDDPPSALAEMNFAAAASLALSRVDLMVRRPRGEDVPAGQLAEELAARALGLAARFDERNGTSHQGELVRAVLTAEPWVEYLPLSETARRAHARQQARAVAPGVDDLPGDDASSVSPAPASPPVGREWLDRAEEAWQNYRRDESVAAWEAFEREVAEADRTPLDQARLLDLKGLASYEDPEAALDCWREALTIYSSLGEEARLLRDRARISRLLGYLGQIEEALATGEAPMRWLIANDEPRRRAGWQDSLATMYAQAGRFEEAVVELAAARQLPETDGDQLANSAILHSNLLTQLDRLDEAEDAATAGLSISEDLPRSLAYRQRGRIRTMLERPAEAIDDLEEAIAIAVGQPGAELHIAFCQVDLARAYLLGGRALEAAETAEEASPSFEGDPDFAGALAEARGVLIDAYRALGELDTALSFVRLQLTDAPEDAHPHWLGLLRQDEGMLLERLDRDQEAVDALLAAAEYFEAAERPIEFVQALRLAGQSARYSGDFDLVRQLLDRCRPVLDALPSADDTVVFQQAGVHWDLALLELQVGDVGSAVTQARQAAEYYERGGFEGQLINARLLVAEHGTTDDTLVREIFNALPAGDPAWHRAGYLLADRLRALGRPEEASTLEAQLRDS